MPQFAFIGAARHCWGVVTLETRHKQRHNDVAEKLPDLRQQKCNGENLSHNLTADCF
jgi:hypothetical protein